MHVSRARQGTVENRREALVSVSVWHAASIPARHWRGDPHFEADTNVRSEEPNPVSLVRDCFQAARGHEVDESTPRIQRIIVRKIRRNLAVTELGPKTIC